MATRGDPQGIHPSVPSVPGDYVARSLRRHVLRGLSRLWAAIAGHEGVLHRCLAVVRVLSLSLCEAWGAVHHALAETSRLLRSECWPVWSRWLLSPSW